jgi:hypothetical protein
LYLTFSLAVVLTFVLYFTWYQKLPPFGVDGVPEEVTPDDTLCDAVIEDQEPTDPHLRPPPPE